MKKKNFARSTSREKYLTALLGKEKAAAIKGAAMEYRVSAASVAATSAEGVAVEDVLEYEVSAASAEANEHERVKEADFNGLAMLGEVALEMMRQETMPETIFEQVIQMEGEWEEENSPIDMTMQALDCARQDALMMSPIAGYGP